MNSQTRSLISTIAGFAALALLVMTIIYWAAFTTPAFNMNIAQWDWTLRVLAILTIVCFAVYLVVSPESIGAAAGKRSTRLTANALVVSLVAVGIGIAINIITANVPVARADLTAGQQFTLSEQTIKVIQSVDQRAVPVDAVAFYSDQQPGSMTRDQIQQLLKEYSSHSSKLKYEIVDPYQSPARAAELGATALNTVIFTDGKKKETANTIAEGDLTSALARLLDDKTKTVAFLQGHGERNPQGSGQNDYSTIQTTLTSDNYKVINWNLVTSPTLTVKDVTVLVIAAPQTPLSPKETQAVQSYLNGGGHVLLEVDPQMPDAALTPMATILQKYGVTPVKGVVLDQKSLSPQDPTVVVVNSFPTNDITKDLSANGATVVFPLAMGFKVPTSTVGSMVVSQLIQSSPSPDQSWLETNLQSQQATYDAGKDLPGPVSMGLTIAPQSTDTSTTTLTNTDTINTKLVVYSDADFPSNYAIQQFPSNGDLFANSVAWLAGNYDLVSVRAKAANTPRTLTLDATQKNLIFTASVLALPILVLMFGAFTWWRRR
jgi:ABC-type uncharacterized transport system involved in gliding motility auxiliary subunit